MHSGANEAGLLEGTINRLLALDEETRAGITRYAGSMIAIELQNTRQNFYIRITSAGIRLTDRPQTNPDVTIRGTPGRLLAYLMAMKRDETATAGSIEITGNIALAQKLSGALRDLDPDWEELLSGWIGDSLARHAGNTLRKTLQRAGQAGDTLRTNTGEYLRFESGMIAEPAEVDEFVRAVDVLRNDVERLRVRLDRLQQQAARWTG